MAAIADLLVEIHPALPATFRTPSVMLYMGMLDWTCTWYNEIRAVVSHRVRSFGIQSLSRRLRSDAGVIRLAEASDSRAAR